MPILHLIFAVTLTFAVPQDCADWQTCRDEAVAAASREEFERFHDLAWRAVQKGPKNDPALMLMLARAQALSGRPGDALVMLDRLVRMGVAVDVGTDADFRRVRALPGWAELEARIAGTPVTAVPEPAREPEAPPVPPPAAAAVTPKRAVKTAPPPSEPPMAAAPAPAPKASRAAEPAEALRFSSGGLTPVGLAYDAVSRRFLVADRTARKLTVVDEFSSNVATLAGAQAAFGDIEALEIDPRAGDLWVVSSEPDAAGGATTLHKLQLVSGRVLATFTVPPALAPAHFVDVAVANGGTILVLDAGGRILRLKGSALEFAAAVPAGSTSLAPTDNGTVLVSTPEGLVRVELGSRAILPVIPPEGADLSGITRVRWYRGSLVARQAGPGGARVIRLGLGRGGRAVTAVDPVDAIGPNAGAFTIAGGTLYYFASKGGGEVVLKKVPL